MRQQSMEDSIPNTFCCQDAFTRLCELDANGTSHIFEVSVDGSMSALYNAFAKLLAHPLQRPLQGNPVNYEITSAEQLSG